MAIPHPGPATHGQAVAKAPCKGAANCGQGQPARGDTCGHGGLRLAYKGGNHWQRSARMGLPPLASYVASMSRV
ncbi:hypothetical protein BHM03_00025989 [Ensete ventricosum]|nr:hypothetical protein BHM03_00025989 [Ensete ventricosum]